MCTYCSKKSWVSLKHENNCAVNSVAGGKAGLRVGASEVGVWCKCQAERMGRNVPAKLVFKHSRHRISLLCVLPQ